MVLLASVCVSVCLSVMLDIVTSEGGDLEVYLWVCAAGTSSESSSHVRGHRVKVKVAGATKRLCLYCSRVQSAYD